MAIFGQNLMVCGSPVAAQSRLHSHGGPYSDTLHRCEHRDFSVVDALLLKSLPYSHPERMGTIYTRVAGPAGSDNRHHLNGEQWELLRDNVPSLISSVSLHEPRVSIFSRIRMCSIFTLGESPLTISMCWPFTLSSVVVSRKWRIVRTDQEQRS